MVELALAFRRRAVCGVFSRLAVAALAVRVGGLPDPLAVAVGEG